ARVRRQSPSDTHDRREGRADSAAGAASQEALSESPGTTTAPTPSPPLPGREGVAVSETFFPTRGIYSSTLPVQNGCFGRCHTRPDHPMTFRHCDVSDSLKCVYQTNYLPVHYD